MARLGCIFTEPNAPIGKNKLLASLPLSLFLSLSPSQTHTHAARLPDADLSGDVVGVVVAVIKKNIKNLPTHAPINTE